MTPERKFEEVRDYITETIKRMHSTATAIEMAELKAEHYDREAAFAQAAAAKHLNREPQNA